MGKLQRRSGTIPAWAWIALIGSLSIVLSRAFACATPFAALATLAAFTLRGRDAVALILFTWAANQAVGFGLLHYPTDVTTLAWGLAIGIAAMAGLGAAEAGARWIQLPRLLAIAVSFLLAYAAYEAALLSATLLLPSGSGAFALAVMLRILAINAVALVLLLSAGWAVGRGLHPVLRSHAT